MVIKRKIEKKINEFSFSLQIEINGGLYYKKNCYVKRKNENNGKSKIKD